MGLNIPVDRKALEAMLIRRVIGQAEAVALVDEIKALRVALQDARGRICSDVCHSEHVWECFNASKLILRAM